MSSVYLVGQISIKNMEKWVRYREKVPLTLEPWAGEITFRGKLAAVLAGEHPHTDIVVICFPNQAALDGWHNSSAYQALIPLRQQAAEVVLLSYTA